MSSSKKVPVLQLSSMAYVRTSFPAAFNLTGTIGKAVIGFPVPTALQTASSVSTWVAVRTSVDCSDDGFCFLVAN